MLNHAVFSRAESVLYGQRNFSCNRGKTMDLSPNAIETWAVMSTHASVRSVATTLTHEWEKFLSRNSNNPNYIIFSTYFFLFFSVIYFSVCAGCKQCAHWVECFGHCSSHTKIVHALLSLLRMHIRHSRQNASRCHAACPHMLAIFLFLSLSVSFAPLRLVLNSNIFIRTHGRRVWEYDLPRIWTLPLRTDCRRTESTLTWSPWEILNCSNSVHSIRYNIIIIMVE